MAYAGVTITLRSSRVNSKAGPTDHVEMRDRFVVPRSKDTSTARESNRHTKPNSVDCLDRLC